jgi:2-polyprenyl-3-methyl-5-hydroxy-6-metoxy-1,4-benzoquinol methylase
MSGAELMARDSQLAPEWRASYFSNHLEFIRCPLCETSDTEMWGAENGFNCVKCIQCGLVYVNPRPSLEEISHANEIGEHRTTDAPLKVVYKRSRRKARRYASTIAAIFPDVMTSSTPVSWLDVGAGFGELVEVLQSMLPPGSRVMGVEPMAPKVAEAQRIGLPIYQKDLAEISERFHFISLINVFSHVPDFRDFLARLRPLLRDDGEIFIETGNGGDLASMREYPDLLYLPDHLVFAGEKHLQAFLADAGFSIVSTNTFRVDTAGRFAKNLIKKAISQDVKLSMPYRSRFRRVLVRARLRPSTSDRASTELSRMQ